MDREKLKAIIETSTWGGSLKATKEARERRLLAEFDRLNKIIENQSNLILDMGKRGAELKSWLNRISEPMAVWSKENKTNMEFILNEKEMRHATCSQVALYLDSQSQGKPGQRNSKTECTHEKTEVWLVNGVRWLACSDCKNWIKPNPEMEQCPEWKQTHGINLIHKYFRSKI